MCARGEAEEVDTRRHAFDADLLSASGNAVGHDLSHAVVHRVGVFNIATVDVKGVVDGVGIDAEVAFGFFDGIEELDDDAHRDGHAFRIFGHHAVGVVTFVGDRIEVSGLSGLADFKAVAADDVVDGAFRSVPSQRDANRRFGFGLEVLNRIESTDGSATAAAADELVELAAVDGSAVVNNAQLTRATWDLEAPAPHG